MVDRKSIRIMTAMVTTIFVLAFISQGIAFPGPTDTPFTYSGKIVTIDNFSKSITVQAGPHNELSFVLDTDGLVLQCNVSSSFADLKVGDWVTVSYFQEIVGSNIANWIDYTAPGMQHC